MGHLVPVWLGLARTGNGTALAEFIVRPQAEAQIGATR
jgi:hypothetical protein